MSVQLVRFTAHQANVADIEAAIKPMIAAVHAAAPTGTRYALCKLPDGITFLAILELADGTPNPLLGIPAATEFRENLTGWVVTAPSPPEQLDVVGSYRLFA